MVRTFCSSGVHILSTTQLGQVGPAPAVPIVQVYRIKRRYDPSTLQVTVERAHRMSIMQQKFILFLLLEPLPLSHSHLAVDTT